MASNDNNIAAIVVPTAIRQAVAVSRLMTPGRSPPLAIKERNRIVIPPFIRE
jgi:hypothetical protein